MVERVTVGGDFVTVDDEYVTVPIIIYHSTVNNDEEAAHLASGTENLVGTEISFLGPARYNKSLPSGNTAFTFADESENRGVMLALYPEVDSTVSWPAGTLRMRGEFDPTATNYVYILCLGINQAEAMEYGLTYTKALT